MSGLDRTKLQAILACVVREPHPLSSGSRSANPRVVSSIMPTHSPHSAGTLQASMPHDRLMECANSVRTPQKSSPMTWATSQSLLRHSLWGWTTYQQPALAAPDAEIRTMPGVVVTTLERNGNKCLEGLRDPLADPEELLAEEESPRANYLAGPRSTPLTLNSSASAQPPPPSAGDCDPPLRRRPPHYQWDCAGSWAIKPTVAPLASGVREYLDADLHTVSRADLITQVNRISFFFESGSSTLSSRIEQDHAGKTPTRRLAPITLSSSGGTIVVEAIGDADPAGPETMNFLLATARAHAVIAALGGAASYHPLTLSASVEPTSFTGQKRGGTKGNPNARRRVTLLVTPKPVAGLADSAP